MAKEKSVYAVILAGGVGSRFWPLSRQLEPKQFHSVIGKRTLIQDTVWRIKDKIKNDKIFLVTNSAYFFDLQKQIASFRIPKQNILLEPEGKSTAPAIGWVAKCLYNRDPEAIMIVLPSDHLILKAKKFLQILDSAVRLALEDHLVTLGVRPARPDTGYGYLKISEKRPPRRRAGKAPARQKSGGQSGKLEYYMVERFLEKPNQQKADEYFRDKHYLWNSGIFVWKARVILEEMKRYLPNLYTRLEDLKGEGFNRVWKKLPTISIDYGILEKSRKVVTLPAEIGWSDLGSWQALSQAVKKDKDGNIIRADCINLDSKGLFVLGSERLITTVGLRDLVLVDTPDALLVCRKDLSQRVKDIVEILKKKRRPEHILHKTVKRPWGSYTVLNVNRGFSAKGRPASGWKIKLVEVYPGNRLSLQLHRKRAEHWVVVEGIAKVQTGKQIRLVKSNQSIYIPAQKLHRLGNPAKTPLRIVEVQTGNYLEEDDIVRFKDDYERLKT